MNLHMVKLPLQKELTPEQEKWLLQNVGPRLHWMSHSRGGLGWVAKSEWEPGMVHKSWYLTFDDDRYATFFRLMFPE